MSLAEAQNNQLHSHERERDADWALEIAAEPHADELLSLLGDTAMRFLKDLPEVERRKAQDDLNRLVRDWAQEYAEDLLEARARNAEPVGGWES